MEAPSLRHFVLAVLLLVLLVVGLLDSAREVTLALRP